MARIIVEDGQVILRDDWSIGDVESVAECMEVELTDAQMESVLRHAARCFDATVGINWDVIEQCIEFCLNDKEKFK
jgi:hypothetical protein